MENSSVQIANDTILLPSALSMLDCQRILKQSLTRHVDYADLYFQYHEEEAWSLEDGIVKACDFSIDKGFGLRAINEEKTGFAYSNQIDSKQLLLAADTVRSIERQGQHHQHQLLKTKPPPSLYKRINPAASLNAEEKVALLRALDAYARAKDQRVRQVKIQLSCEYDVVLIINNEQQIAADVRPLVHMHVRLILEANGRRESGAAGSGGRVDYQFFLDEKRAYTLVDRAFAQAERNLHAEDAPAGTLPVVLGPGWPAVLLHEAVGHGLEGDFNRKQTSIFSNRLGEQVVSPLCTIVDDGTIKSRRGSLNIDDEGIPTQHTTLIENGVLKNYMQDRLNARLMKMQPTGNGRRESYASLPLPRMTNTYMLPGEHAPQEILSSVKYGVYAVDFAGGEVDITSGNFVFSASEAYLIEDGKVTQPIKGMTLIGNGPQTLRHVTMVGNDLALDSGIGTCGKAGQSVPVGVGQPTLKISQMTVGGHRK